jgi:hypothetical protein
MLAPPAVFFDWRKQMRTTHCAWTAILCWGLLWPLQPAAGDEKPVAQEHALTVIAGTPRARGRAYAEAFRDQIHKFLNAEIYQAFNDKPATREDMRSYAAACAGEIKNYSPIIYQELQGMAEGARLTLDEIVLITLHEELYHRGALPKVQHCTAVAVGPPETRDGHTFIGQTWDWMPSVYGQSTLLHWRREEGPSLLAYAYPGLWCGAGMNSAGIALCWTSASLGDKSLGARVGIPSYVLLAHLLYQGSMSEVVAEARRATNAGWFTFVMADGEGRLVNIEGSPRGMVVEEHRGRLARVLYGSREMTQTPRGERVKLHARCQKMYDLLSAESGRIDLGRMQHFFQDPGCGISVGKSTLDMMIYDTTAKAAWLSRGPAYGTTWKKFEFAPH